MKDGFKQSKIDPCLLMKKDIFIILYCDDTGIAAKNEKIVNDLIQRLRDQGFELTQEGTFSEFLGIKYEEDKSSGTIHLTQKGLIDKIINATGMEDCNPNWTPATKAALAMDPEGEPMNEHWSYPSIVGMLLYLSTNTRPDISFAVSQVARFTHAPKKSHASAIKTIVRYSKRTADKGTIVKISNKLDLDCYVDADFAGLFNRDPHHESSSAKSRTGYLINLGGCPLIWKSQLQSSVALSTGEAEYSALSQSMRSLLPIREQLIEFNGIVDVPSSLLQSSDIIVHTTVHEDNNNALMLATSQRITSRTKYYATKWHFFWEKVKRGIVKVVKVPSDEQCADYFTKGLVRDLFEKCRKHVQGW